MQDCMPSGAVTALTQSVVVNLVQLVIYKPGNCDQTQQQSAARNVALKDLAKLFRCNKNQNHAITFTWLLTAKGSVTGGYYYT